MTDLNPELIEKALREFVKPRMTTNMSLDGPRAKLAAALSAVADDLRAEGAKQERERLAGPHPCCPHCAEDPIHVIDPEGHEIPCQLCEDETLTRVRTESVVQALEDAADEVDSLYFGPDQHTPFTRGAALLWGAKEAAKRVRARAAELREARR